MAVAPPHFLLVTLPAQGHINPCLQFAKRVVRFGARVTLVTSVPGIRLMAKTASFPEDDGLSFATFSDGYDDGFKAGIHDPAHHSSEFRRLGSRALSDLIVAASNEGKPFACVVVTLVLSWAAEVARKHHLPSAVLWIQPATVLDIYYHYFNSYDDLFANCSDPTYCVELPGLPLLFTSLDFPSFFFSSKHLPLALLEFKEQLDRLSKEDRPKVLVNTFDALESEALKAIDNFSQVAIGPLVLSPFLDGEDPSDTSLGGDLYQGSKDYMEWLDTKPKSSVVYVSFGSLSILSKQQMQEMARGLLLSGHPFLWVIREQQQKIQEDGKDSEKEGEPGDPLMGYVEELKEQGMMVPWCSQLEVLSHPAVGCFLTHGGWNSTLESLSVGVPMVVFPQWSDQMTVSKLIKDVWKIGVRVVASEDGLVDRNEVRSCLDLFFQSGGKGEELRSNAKALKDRARDAVKEGGSSYQNLKAFVDDAREGRL